MASTTSTTPKPAPPKGRTASRASRGAAKNNPPAAPPAQGEGGGTLQAALEASLAASTGKNVVAIGAGGRSATGDNGGGRKGAAAPAAAAPAKTPPAKPATSSSDALPPAKVSTGKKMTPTWFPTATVQDGKKVVELACPHTKYGHETEDAARKCINHIVRAAGYDVPAAKVAAAK